MFSWLPLPAQVAIGGWERGARPGPGPNTQERLAHPELSADSPES